MSEPLQTELRAFNVAFDQYRKANRRNVSQLIEQRGRRLRFALWREFRALAKTAATLRAELAARGWEMKRRPNPDFIGPGAPLVSPKREIQLRTRSLKFLSVSFLFREWRTRREGQDARFTARSRAQARLGVADVRTGPATENPFVALVSFLEGVVRQDEKHGIGSRVLRAETADMRAYLARKHREEMARHFNRPFAPTIRVA